jgi:hypothetical protein
MIDEMCFSCLVFLFVHDSRDDDDDGAGSNERSAVTLSLQTYGGCGGGVCVRLSVVSLVSLLPSSITILSFSKTAANAPPPSFTQIASRRSEAAQNLEKTSSSPKGRAFWHRDSPLSVAPTTTLSSLEEQSSSGKHTT